MSETETIPLDEAVDHLVAALMRPGVDAMTADARCAVAVLKTLRSALAGQIELEGLAIQCVRYAMANAMAVREDDA